MKQITLSKSKKSFTFDDLKKIECRMYPHEYVDRFTYKNVYVDPTLQTKNRWSVKDRDSFLYTLIVNTHDGIILLLDIESALKKAQKDDNYDDFKFLNDLKNKGYLYIIMDGNHRTQILWKHKNLKVFPHKSIGVVIVKSISINEMHDYTQRNNKQKSWSKSEMRNSYVTPVSDLIRKISNKHVDITDLLKIKNDRYQNQEFFTILLHILNSKYKNTYKDVKVSPNALDDMYFNGINDDLYENFDIIINVWSKIVKNFHRKSSKIINKMFWVTLFLFSEHLLNNRHNYLNDDVYIDLITTNFIRVIEQINNDNNLLGSDGLFSNVKRYSYVNLDERLKYFINNIKH